MSKSLCLLVFGLLALVACTTETNIFSSQVSAPTDAPEFASPTSMPTLPANQVLPRSTPSTTPRRAPSATPTLSRTRQISAPTPTERPVITLSPTAMSVIFFMPIPTTPAAINTAPALATATPIPTTPAPVNTAIAFPSATSVLYMDAETNGIAIVRLEPTTDAATIYILKPHTRIWLVARLEDSSWFLMQFPGVKSVPGWVVAQEVTFEGAVESLKIYRPKTITPVAPPTRMVTIPPFGTPPPLQTPPATKPIPSPRATVTPPPVNTSIITVVIPSPPTSAITAVKPTPALTTIPLPTWTRTRTPIPPYPPPYP